MKTEDDVINALGLKMGASPPASGNTDDDEEDEEPTKVVPAPEADTVDLSQLRGTKAPSTTAPEPKALQSADRSNNNTPADLEALAELVPALKSQTSPEGERIMTVNPELVKSVGAVENEDVSPSYAEEMPIEVEAEAKLTLEEAKKESMRTVTNGQRSVAAIPQVDSLQVQDSHDFDDKKPSPDPCDAPISPGAADIDTDHDRDDVGTDEDDDDQNLRGFEDVADSEIVMDSDDEGLKMDGNNPYAKKLTPGGVPTDFNGPISSAASLSTATATQPQTHEVRMPMYLPTFKPATGCTNASDFIVRCFVARLRSGITVVKHGRSRWCKSRLRILHIHPDGRSLSWKPAVGEPTSSKRPPKLDLSTCMEVRHAWSPDPLNPMFTGTPILRQKCEAANAHKSFALVFPKRTVDITAVTADQCKVLMEGFSALCFRLQVANLAGRKHPNNAGGTTGNKATGEENEDNHTTTASVTLTNSSNPISPSTKRR